MTRPRYTAAEMGRVTCFDENVYYTHRRHPAVLLYLAMSQHGKRIFVYLLLFNALKEFEFTIIPHRERENKNNNNKNKGNKKEKKWK